MSELYYKLSNILNASDYYKKTIQFMTNEDLDIFIKNVDPTWQAPYNYEMKLKFKCLKVLEIMTGETFGVKA